MAATDKETLLEELNLLLDRGKPLVSVFPKHGQENWWLELPDNTSIEMRCYARHVVWSVWDLKEYQHVRQQYSTVYLSGLVKTCQAGLLGWRAVGVLK